jgi:hypothetical protein
MALDLKLKYFLKPDGLSILAYDQTGYYNSVSNTTGWGSPNQTIGSVTSFSITVKRPDPTTLLVSDDTSLWYTISAFPTLPNIVGNPFTISNTDIGLSVSESIPDGEYEFSVVCRIDDGVSQFLFTDRVRYVFYSSVFCCKENLKSKLDLKDIGCKPCRDKMQDVLFMELGIDGIIYNNNCGDTNSAIEILKTLKSMCEKEGCSGCN